MKTGCFPILPGMLTALHVDFGDTGSHAGLSGIFCVSVIPQDSPNRIDPPLSSPQTDTIVLDKGEVKW